MLDDGRPRALDEVKCREICALISVGCNIDAAARYVGCHPRTIRRHRDRDEEFRQQFARAELNSRVEPLRAMRTAASSNWRAAAWLLERIYPDQFARTRPRSFASDADEKLLDEIAAWDDSQLASAAAELAARIPPPPPGE